MRWGAGGQRGRRIRCEVRTAGCSELGPPPPRRRPGWGRLLPPGCACSPGLSELGCPPASCDSSPCMLTVAPCFPLPRPVPGRSLRCVIGVGPRNSVVRVLERSSPPVCSSSVWVILSFLPFPFTYAKNPFHTRSICVRTT